MPEVALVCEDKAHAVVVERLIRLVVRRHAYDTGEPWVSDILPHLLQWQGRESLEDLVPGLRYSTHVQAAAEIPDGFMPRPRGLFGGLPIGPAATHWRKILTNQVALEVPFVTVVVDTDGDDDTMAAIRRVVSEYAMVEGRHVLLIAPHPEIEAWLVAGFVPQNTLERDRLAKLDLHFDPTQKPHQLVSTSRDAAHDAKRVLQQLIYGTRRSVAPAREDLVDLAERCLPDLDHPNAQAETGLLDARGAIVTVLYPLLDQ